MQDLPGARGAETSAGKLEMSFHDAAFHVTKAFVAIPNEDTAPMKGCVNLLICLRASPAPAQRCGLARDESLPNSSRGRS
jgi:hypothetical protein